uniref:DNA topoisomerase 1 n=1 Tax=Macrostomum lignano TaxID=282301 RepID=A0A1I8GFG3_9PLAT
MTNADPVNGSGSPATTAASATAAAAAAVSAIKPDPDGCSSSDDDVPLSKKFSSVVSQKKQNGGKRANSGEDSSPSPASKKPKTEPTTPTAQSPIKTPKKEPTSQKKKVKKEADHKRPATAKKEDKKKVKAESDSKRRKSEPVAKPKRERKTEEPAPEVWRWWEEEKPTDGSKWRFLEHKGPVFAPDYEPLPKNVKFYYDGEHMVLTPEAEEVAGFYARMLDHDYTSKESFNNNFFQDWRSVMSHAEQKRIKSLAKCNFTEIHEFYKRQAEERKNRTKEEKQKLKETNEKMTQDFGHCTLDGHRQRIGNFKIEPPGLFRGRGNHPKMGKLKRRVQPEDVIINCSKDSAVPKPPPGHKWKEVRHDNTVSWLACWVENVQGNFKYVMLNAASRLKGEKDWKKYETARQLHKVVDKIRSQYRADFKSKEMRLRQRSVALYFIDKLALRAGNEKDDDEADTGKKEGDDLFDRLNTSILNAHLKELMDGLTAKVFRTYNASKTLEDQLEKLTNPDEPQAAKILAYNRANREVAILCNHQRAVPKTFEKSMENLSKKLEDKEAAVKAAKREAKQAKALAKKEKSAKNKQLLKLRVQRTDKDENKEIALGTSKLNYLDPRISVAWCRRFDVPVEKVYNKTQREKFQWAIDMATASFRFQDTESDKATNQLREWFEAMIERKEEVKRPVTTRKLLMRKTDKDIVASEFTITGIISMAACLLELRQTVRANILLDLFRKKLFPRAARTSDERYLKAYADYIRGVCLFEDTNPQRIAIRRPEAYKQFLQDRYTEAKLSLDESAHELEECAPKSSLLASVYTVRGIVRANMLADFSSDALCDLSKATDLECEIRQPTASMRSLLQILRIGADSVSSKQDQNEWNEVYQQALCRALNEHATLICSELSEDPSMGQSEFVSFLRIYVGELAYRMCDKIKDNQDFSASVRRRSCDELFRVLQQNLSSPEGHVLPSSLAVMCLTALGNFSDAPRNCKTLFGMPDFRLHRFQLAYDLCAAAGLVDTEVHASLHISVGMFLYSNACATVSKPAFNEFNAAIFKFRQAAQIFDTICDPLFDADESYLAETSQQLLDMVYPSNSLPTETEIRCYARYLQLIQKLIDYWHARWKTSVAKNSDALAQGFALVLLNNQYQIHEQFTESNNILSFFEELVGEKALDELQRAIYGNDVSDRSLGYQEYKEKLFSRKGNIALLQDNSSSWDCISWSKLAHWLAGQYLRSQDLSDTRLSNCMRITMARLMFNCAVRKDIFEYHFLVKSFQYFEGMIERNIQKKGLTRRMDTEIIPSEQSVVAILNMAACFLELRNLTKCRALVEQARKLIKSSVKDLSFLEAYANYVDGHFLVHDEALLPYSRKIVKQNRTRIQVAVLVSQKIADKRSKAKVKWTYSRNTIGRAKRIFQSLKLSLEDNEKPAFSFLSRYMADAFFNLNDFLAFDDRYKNDPQLVFAVVDFLKDADDLGQKTPKAEETTAEDLLHYLHSTAINMPSLSRYMKRLPMNKAGLRTLGKFQDLEVILTVSNTREKLKSLQRAYDMCHQTDLFDTELHAQVHFEAGIELMRQAYMDPFKPHYSNFNAAILKLRKAARIFEQLYGDDARTVRCYAILSLLYCHQVQLEDQESRCLSCLEKCSNIETRLVAKDSGPSPWVWKCLEVIRDGKAYFKQLSMSADKKYRFLSETDQWTHLFKKIQTAVKRDVPYCAMQPASNEHHPDSSLLADSLFDPLEEWEEKRNRSLKAIAVMMWDREFPKDSPPSDTEVRCYAQYLTKLFNRHWHFCPVPQKLEPEKRCPLDNLEGSPDEVLRNHFLEGLSAYSTSNAEDKSRILKRLQRNHNLLLTKCQQAIRCHDTYEVAY